MMKRFLIISILVVVPCFLFSQTSYTWNGSNNSAWNNNLNWTPNTGFPGAADNATITSAGNSPLLDIPRSVTNLTVSNGTLNLNTFTLVVTAVGTFTSGNVNNGVISCTGTTANFNGTTIFGAKVFANCASIYFRGGTFNDTTTFTKTGTTNDYGYGNNIFNELTTINNSGTGILFFGYNTSIILKTDSFNENIIVNCIGTGGIGFGYSPNSTSILAAGKTITVGVDGFSAGSLILRNFTQTGATPQILTLTGTATLVVGPSSTFNGNVNFTAPGIYLNGCTYNGTATFTKTGTSNDYGTGGNTFNGITTITNNGTGVLWLAFTNRDIFNADVTFTNSGSNSIIIGVAYAIATETQFNGNVILNSTGTSTGISFGQGNGTIALAATRTISIGSSGFSSGDLRLRNFTQIGATTPQSLMLTGTARLFFQTGSTFNSNITSASPGLFLSGTTFNGITIVEKTGTGSNEGTGGNTFNGLTTTIINSGSGAILIGSGNPDVYNTNITFTNTGSSIIYVAYATASTFLGNIFVNSTGSSGGIFFGYGGGASTLAATRTINVGLLGFSAGGLMLTNFTQSDAATAQSLTLTGTSAIYVGPSSVFTGNVNFVAPGIELDGCTYHGVTQIEKNGNTNYGCAGGNIFNNLTTIINSSTAGTGGDILFGIDNPDVFNADVTFTNTGSNRIYLSYAASSTFNENIVVNSINASQGIFFGGGGSTLVATKTITVGSGFSAGTLYLKNFIQQGTTTPQSLTLTGTAVIDFQTGSVFNSAITTVSPYFALNGTTFNNTASLEKTGINNNESYGGATFNGITTIINSSNGILLFAGINFATDVTFNNTGTTINGYMRVAYTGSNAFGGDITFNNTNTNGGIYLGEGGGSSTLAATKILRIGSIGFATGALSIWRLTQIGNTPQSLILTGTTTALSLGTGSVYNGNVTATAPILSVDGATFNGTATLEQTGAFNSHGRGGNIFNQNVTFTNSGSAYMSLAYYAPDAINENIIVNNTGGGTGIYFGQGGFTTTLAQNKTITIGSGGFPSGTLALRRFITGTNTQSLTLTGTAHLGLATGSIFNGNVTFIAPNLHLDGATFNSTAILEQTVGTGGISSDGGTTFNGTTTITNSGAGYMAMSYYTADDFNGPVTFIQTGSGNLLPAYRNNCTFSGNISTVGTATAITFGADDGRVTIDGNGSQTFYGDAAFPPTVRRLTMATSAGGTLALNVNVIISLDIAFNSGIINATTLSSTSTGLLILNNGITISNAADDGSYVRGYVRKIGNTAFDFPVGDGGYYAPVSISAPTTTTHHFTAMYNHTNPHPIYNRNSKDVSIDHISQAEYWMLDRTNGTSNVNVTLSWDSLTRSGSVTNLSDLLVARWNGTQWANHGNGGTTGDVTAGTVVTNGVVTSFSPFTLASTTEENPLPIELLSFTAQLNGTQVALKWVTASEMNNDYFTIERAITPSPNGEGWSEIGTVKGTGNSNTILNYVFYDKHPYTGTSYYRLKQTDYDGKFTYSQIVAVHIGTIDIISIYPNPSDDGYIQYTVASEKGCNINVKVIDMLGREVISTEEFIEKGVTAKKISTAGMGPGNYLLRITNGKEEKVQRQFVVK
ncbi:MAG: T9SS type A sorting domain-containing protein [Bacteroidota bacterium]